MFTHSHGNPLKVLQLTDPHLFADRERALRDTVTWESLSAAIEHYRSGAWQADPELMREQLPDYAWCSTIDTAGWRIVGIDTHEPGVASGCIGAAELERLREVLADSQRPVAIFMHHPPVDLDSKWLDGVGLVDRADFLEVAGESGKVRLVVFGHVHQAFDNMDPEFRIIGTPSTGRQFKPGSRKFAVDDRPPAYRQLEFGEDGSFDTRLIWVNS